MIERKIVIELITNTHFLDNINQILDPNYFQSDAARLIATWVIRHYKAHKKAPKENIQLVFDRYQRTGAIDKENAEDIKEILTSLSEEYSYSPQQKDADFFLKETIEYFNQTRLEKHQEKIAAIIDRGDSNKAFEKIKSFEKIEPLTKTDCNFFKDDPEKTRRIFENVPKPLIEYPGALGRLLNKHMVRGGFLGFLGPEKIGKTWILLDIAFQAQRCGRNVAFFAAGDMNRDEMEMRKYVYLARRSNEREYCEKLYIPVLDCKRSQRGACPKKPWLSDDPVYLKGEIPEKRKEWKAEFFFEKFVEFKDDHEVCTECKNSPNPDLFLPTFWWKEKEECEPLTWKEAYKIEQKHIKRMRGQFQFYDVPADTLTVDLMRAQLQKWKNELGFVPDVVEVDYPDIMASDKSEFRHGENSKWIGLRALAHEWNCLMVAPTQAKSAAYEKTWIEQSDYSEDKRKFAHATAFFGLNQTAVEAELGLFRINQLFVRSGKKGNNYATILQRLEIGRPHLGSF